MFCRSSFPVIETAAIAARVLAALKSGSRPALEAELRLAAQACSRPFQGDTAEDERREVLEEIVQRLSNALAAGRPVSATSRSLAGCVTLLEHLRVEVPGHYFAAAAACRHRATPVLQ